MTSALPRAAWPFFLPVDGGERYCIFHPPAEGSLRRGSVLYVHPFAEEMNKSRRMVAMQCRAMAAAGFGVLQIDLFGCGDSSGTLQEARWDIWKNDLAQAWAWLEREHSGPITLWGLRLGALLALDWVRVDNVAPARILAWQPVLSGEIHLGQFLRLDAARQMLTGGATSEDRTRGARDRLANGETVEIAGYALSPQFAADMARVQLSALPPERIPVHWFEIISVPGGAVPAAAMNVMRTWQERRIDVSLQIVEGAAFWASQEITECPALQAATCQLLEREVAGHV